MTEQVRVPGFAVPPAPAGAVEHSRDRAPNPADMTNGFVSQDPAPAPAYVAPAAPAPAAAPGIDPTVAALLAALSGKQEPAPAAAQPAAPAYTSNSRDPVVSSLSSILASAGVDVARALGKANEYNDASLIDKAYIASVGGANAAHLTQLAESLVAHTGRESEAAEQSCYAIAGSRQNFNAAVAVFNQSAPAHLQTIITTMMDSGDRTQSDAGARMIVEFAKNNGGLVQQAGLITGGAMPGAEAALSKEQFQAELQKLNPNDRDYADRRGELFGRRSMGKKLGR